MALRARGPIFFVRPPPFGRAGNTAGSWGISFDSLFRFVAAGRVPSSPWLARAARPFPKKAGFSPLPMPSSGYKIRHIEIVC
ncbi:hypothetical protein BEN49_13895 [Hymenobacter coccineus]|uniref:Uncharacterized protein n=1 Tax=Hymenobacter coccineus TaxID=1908235 RepID=A0A1G1SV16_9BACT|nr:hypothetical protein BEN49_13895 [Hymenobacter coccineus]